MTEPSDDRTPEADREIARLVERCLAQAESHPALDVEALCAARPELLPAVRARLDALGALGLLSAEGARPADAAWGHTPRPALATRPDTASVDGARQLGPFTLLARLGGGGMGEVHLARQRELGRLVALKLVRPDQLPFAGARERFRQEAEAVARLKHPGIVPVYTVGEEAGIPYLAMECVEGATLEEVLESVAGRDPASLSGADLERAVRSAVERLDALRGGPATAAGSGAGERARAMFGGSWVEAVLRIGLAVTEALQHAHDQGVLHRDVKPSNLMLTADGRVLLLDFGLALRDGGERITRSGAVIGSLAYMPPEQLRGEVRALDGRVDVYALGATLHELLALRTPFSGADQEQLRQAILAGGPPSVREQNPSVGRDAATLVQVALGVRRGDRYPTPAEMGADLTRVLERRPLDARPPSLPVRAGRWVQRRPALAASLILAALVVVGGPLSYAWLAGQHADAMTRVADQARAAEAEAEDASRRAAAEAADAQRARQETERHFDLARQAVDDLLVDVTGNELFEQPHMLDVNRRLLTKALAFHTALVDSRPDDVSLRLDRMQVVADLAFALRKLGRFADARELVTDMRSEVDELRAELGGRAAAHELELDDMGHAARLSLSILDQVQGRYGDALRSRREVLDWLDACLERHPDNAVFRRERPRVQGSLAHLLAGLGRHDEAHELFADSAVSLDALCLERPDDQEVLGQRFRGRREWVASLHAADRHAEVVQRGLEALGFHDQLSAQEQQLLPNRMAYLTMLAQVGGSLGELGRPAEALRLMEAALVVSEPLRADHPEELTVAVVMAAAQTGMVRVLRAQGRVEEARARSSLLIAELERDVARFPDAPEVAMGLVVALSDQSRILREDLGELHASVEALHAAEDVLRRERDRVQPLRWTVEMQQLQRSIAIVQLDRREHAAVVAAAEDRAAVEPDPDWQLLVEAAFMVSRAVPVAAHDESLSEDARRVVVADYVDRALDLLERAVAAGLDVPGEISDHVLWDPLRADPRHAALVERVRAREGG